MCFTVDAKSVLSCLLVAELDAAEFQVVIKTYVVYHILEG